MTGENVVKLASHEEPQLPATQQDLAREEALKLLNEQHAVIDNVGGKCVIASWEKSHLDLSRQMLVYQRPSDFLLRYSNREVRTSQKYLKF